MESSAAYLPSVSVIVPVYNAERTLEDCMDSVLELDYPRESKELIFVDNSSTDGTAEILRRSPGESRILFERKRGPAAARNKGIMNSMGDVIAFTDSDCVVDKDWLRKIVMPLQNEGVGIVGGRILATRPCNKVEEFGETIHDHGKAINEYKPPYVMTMNWASRRSVLNEVGLFDERFIRGQDVDLSWRIFQKGYRLVYEPEAVVRHRNERTLSGLFREGYVHGFASVRGLKQHRDLVKRFGHRRFNRRSYHGLWLSMLDVLRGKNTDHSTCYLLFNLGKKIGKIVGSMRFLYMEL
jgi:glycosyltransferase involved in cell wall biosynthesis